MAHDGGRLPPQAIALEPRHLEAKRLRATALRNTRRQAEAIAEYEEARRDGGSTLCISARLADAGGRFSPQVLEAHPWATGVVAGIYKSTRALEAKGEPKGGGRLGRGGGRFGGAAAGGRGASGGTAAGEGGGGSRLAAAAPPPPAAQRRRGVRSRAGARPSGRG